MQKAASIHPTSTSVQRLFNFSWKFMIEGEREPERQRKKDNKTQPRFALFGINRAAQQPEEKVYIISVHLHPDSTVTQNILWVTWRPIWYSPWTQEPYVTQWRSTVKVRGQKEWLRGRLRGRLNKKKSNDPYDNMK